ncbi:hypothetical protein HOLDEFILI_03794 [Holdemania filiformis DSM 12042]|uniref:Uncharacterized protein n=1 Tax=Holdemania filiformis DSM 12042 TaxID=545696 RepID=B9YD78_9FIRM|nr:hypothetical protein HOLDEFILI_03794 [Holdemania filiformis DSM 12042]
MATLSCFKPCCSSYRARGMWIEMTDAAGKYSEITSYRVSGMWIEIH